MAALGNLLSALDLVRRRAFLNTFLRECLWCLSAVLLALALAALLSPSLYWALVAAAWLTAAGVAAGAWHAYRARPSRYQAAFEMDRAGGLKDRLSTAFFFTAIQNPEGLLARQRKDALEHLSRCNPQELFPVRLPRVAKGAALLLAAVAGLFAYRIYSGPPLLAALQRAAQTQLVKSILSPITHAMDKERARAQMRPAEQPRGGQVNYGSEAPNNDQANSQGAAADGRSPDSGSRAGQEKGAAARQQAQDRQKPEGAASSSAGQEGSQAEDGQQGNEQQGGGEPAGRQEQAGGAPQNGAGKNDQAGRDQQGSDSGSQNASNRNQSLASQVLQALKNLLSTANGGRQAQSRGQTGQNPSQASQPQSGPQAGNAGSQSPEPSQGSQQASQSASQSSSGRQQGDQKAGTGIGQEPGSEQGKRAEALNATPSPDRIALQTQPFTGEAQVRARPGEGQVRTPTRDVPLPSAASVTGAEQENVPLRYRLYLQRYFDQAAKGRR